MSPSQHYTTTTTTPPTHTPSTETTTSLSALLASQHMNGHSQSMDARQSEYSQPGLNSPFASYPDHPSEEVHADQASAAQYQQDVKFAPQDVRSSTLSPDSSTPNSDYHLQPQSARSATFPDYIQQQQQQQQQQQPTASSQQARPYQDGAQRYQQQQPHPGHAAMAQSNPSIASSSPQYAPHQQYSPYPPQHEMHGYPGQPGAPMYAPRPEWAGHYGTPMYHGQVTAAGGVPAMVSQVPRPPGGGHPLSTVYSFVPIPGAQQHKRPRRRYEEIERMYKCGWQGCEKAYGTLNHLNAHVTMQSHGQKRTPEEFKEIRKEWKAKKKEEENARKADEERQRQEHANRQQDGTPTQGSAQYPPQHMMPPAMSGAQLPPIGYAPAAPAAGAQYTPQQQPVDGTQQYTAGQMYANGYPQSPYAAQGGQMYGQR